MNASDNLRVGLTPDRAVTSIEEGNRNVDVLFISENWFAPFALACSPVSPQQLSPMPVDALRDALYKRRPLEDVADFVEQQPMTWEDFAHWQADRALREHLDEARAGLFPWEDVAASESNTRLQRAHAHEILHKSGRACPGSGRSGAELTWIYFSSPDWTWQ